ncbi:hypothetical protein FSP39_011633 [Pinctada imbricata]|uniref:Exocyst complex component 7 n=1 Tax=Pinctada imbricata TaxID=66713 RepID=A0AA88XYH4_PINIB|nr:hypothetical protein FSP39_011633 [Pinctada imbricata]
MGMMNKGGDLQQHQVVAPTAKPQNTQCKNTEQTSTKRRVRDKERGPIHGKTVDEDDSNRTTIKPSTEAVGQEKRCSFDKDSLSSRADQNDDNSENSNSKVKFFEKKSEDIHPTCDDTTTDNNAEAVATSNVKGSNEEPTDQGDNKEQTNLKDGGNETKNVEVTSETYTGDENYGMEENASNDEDNSKGTTSKPSTEGVGKEKSCSFDKDSSSSRADQGDNRERVNLKDGENRINNVEVTSDTNIGDENNGMEENASNDEGTTSKPSTEAVGQEKSFSFDKDSSSSRAHENDENDESNWNVDADKCHNSSDEQMADIDLKSNAKNKAEKIKENRSEVQNAQKQGYSLDSPSIERVKGLRRPQEDTTKKLVDDIEQSRETEKQTKKQAEVKSVRQTSNITYGEKKSEEVHPPSDGTLIGNREEAANSNEKGSNEAPANQGENRKLTNLKDGENEINNVKISSETNIGDSDGSSSNVDTETDETETSDENSKGPDQIVSALDLNGTGTRYENRTERNEVIENKPPIKHDETFKGEDNFHQRRDIKEEKILHDNDGRRCPGLKKPDEEAYVTDGNEHDPYNKTNQRHYQHSLEGFKSTLPPCNIENDRETEEISVSYGKDILRNGQEKETSKGEQFRIDDSDMIQGNGGTEFHVPYRYLYDRGVNKSEIPLLGLSSDDLPGTHSQEFQVGTPSYNAQIGEYVHSHPFIQGGLQIYQPNANEFNQHFDNDDNDQVGIGNNLPAAGGPSSPNDPDRDRLRNELIAKDQQIAELLAQIADLRMRERRNIAAIVNTEYEKNSLRRERDEARRTISTLTMTKDGLIDDLTGLEGKYRFINLYNANNDKNGLNDDVKTLRENIRILEERLHTTEEDNVTKDANIDIIRSKNSELQANCETLSENLTAAKKKCISLEANQRRLDEKVQCLEKDLEKLAEENTAKSVEISSLKESCGTLKESENHHRGECDKLRKAYDEEKDKTRFMEDRMNSLSGRVDALEAETEQKDNMIHRKESARQAANEAMQKSQDQNQVLCEQLRDLQSLQVQLEQEKAKNHAATEQLIALRQQLSGMDTMQRNIHIWWEEYRLAMNERTQEKADYETCRRRLQTLESELVYVKEERDSLRETTRVDQTEKDRLNAHKHDLTTKLQNQVGQITNMSEEVRNRREAMDTYRREKENLKDRSFELERSLLTAERQIEGLRRDISDRDRDILYLRAQLSDVSDPRDGDGDDGGPGHGSRGHGNQAGSTPGETNSGQQGCFPNIQSSTVHYRPQTPSNSIKDKEKQNIKDKFSGFNKELEEISRVQQAYDIPDPELRDNIKKDNKEYIVPRYKLFLEKFQRLNFTKNPEKYMKYTVKDVEETLDKFFDTSAVMGQNTPKRQQKSDKDRI